MFACFLYHQTEAPTGRKFTSEADYERAVADGWVDTPTKFPVLGTGLQPKGADPTLDAALTTAAKRPGRVSKETFQ
mgnify:CR=1 FL=1